MFINFFGGVMEYIVRLNQKVKEYIKVPNDIKAKYIIMIITSYFIGRINFYDTFSVFSIALYIASIKNKTCTLLYTLIMFASCIQTGQTVIVTKFILMIFFTFLITHNVKKNSHANIQKMSIYKLSLMYSSLYLVLSIALLILNDEYNTFNMFLEFLSSMLIFTMSIMLNKSYKFLINNHKINIIEKDTIISALIYLILFLVSMQGIFIQGIYLQEVLILLILEIVAYTMGEVYAGITGTLITIPIILSGGYEISLSILSFIGIIMGMLKSINKYLFALVYTAITYVLYLTYADSLNLSITFISNLIIVQMIFMIIPTSRYDLIRQKCEDISRLKKKVYYEKVKCRVSNNMKNESEKIKKFAKTLEDVLTLDITKEKHENLIDNTIKKVCANCTMQEKCWKENFYTTYTCIMEMFRKVEEESNRSTLIEKFKRSNCINYISMINELTLEHKRLLVKNEIENKNKNIKNAFLKFSYEMSDRITSMVNDINDYKVFRTHIEEKIYNDMIEKDINLLRISVTQKENDRYEIEFSIEKGNGDNNINDIEEQIIYEISKMLKRKFKIINKNLDIENEVSYRICEKENISLDYGIFQMQKYNADDNGDKYTIIRPNDMEVLVAVSDGMGKGKNAANKSKTALKLLECLVSLNLEEKFMIELINTFLLNDQEMFTTLDLCLIDLYAKTGKFMKSGSVSSYIKKKEGNVIKVESCSLPIGIVDEAEVQICNQTFEKGDLIILISDGVIDNINGKYEKESYLMDMIKKIDSHSAQEFSFNLGSIIARNNVLKDDMTILSIKVY